MNPIAISSRAMLVLAAIVTMGLCASSFASPDNHESDLISLERERYSSMVSVDTEALDEVLAEELIFTHASGKVDTRETFLASLTSGSLDYKSIETEDLEVRQYESAAVVTGKSLIDINVRGEDRYLVLRFTSVWVRMPDGWRIVAYQSTWIPE